MIPLAPTQCSLSSCPGQGPGYLTLTLFPAYASGPAMSFIRRLHFTFCVICVTDLQSFTHDVNERPCASCTLGPHISHFTWDMLCRNHVPVRRPVRAGGHPEPERHEPEAQPMARVLLLRPRPAELRAQDMEGLPSYFWAHQFPRIVVSSSAWSQMHKAMSHHGTCYQHSSSL